MTTRLGNCDGATQFNADSASTSAEYSVLAILQYLPLSTSKMQPQSPDTVKTLTYS